MSKQNAPSFRVELDRLRGGEGWSNSATTNLRYTKATISLIFPGEKTNGLPGLHISYNIQHYHLWGFVLFGFQPIYILAMIRVLNKLWKIWWPHETLPLFVGGWGGTWQNVPGLSCACEMQESTETYRENIKISYQQLDTHIILQRCMIWHHVEVKKGCKWSKFMWSGHSLLSGSSLPFHLRGLLFFTSIKCIRITYMCITYTSLLHKSFPQ